LPAALHAAKPVQAATAKVVAEGSEDLQSFEHVWRTIHEKHWDLAGAGADWNAVYKQYRPQAEKAQSREEMRKVITAMIGELGQSHFALLGQNLFHELDEFERRFRSGKASPGFQVSVINDRLFMTHVDPEGPAARAGLHIGEEILAYEGAKAEEIIQKVRKAFAGAVHREFYIARRLNGLFTGPIGHSIALTLADRNPEKQLEISVPLEMPEGKFMPLMNLPPIFFQYTDRMLDNGIGYVHFNVFIPDAKTNWDKQTMTMLREADARGLIIDLRGNGGGLGILSAGMSGRLISERGHKLGTMINKGGTLNFVVFPQPPVFEKPVAVLIDSGSASTSEMMAAGLQDLGRAVVIGEPSAGAALPSVIEILPNGDRFQYAIANYISVKGRTLEGAGVIPDIKAPHTLDSMSRGEDAALTAAIEWIEAQNKNANKNYQANE
jgi:carboxyl-terminal processing protease